MFDNRAYTEITKDELANTEMALAKLDSAYQSNRMTKAMYMSRRERLVKNLERVLSSPTPLATNPTAFYARDELNLSPRPTGYREALEATQQLDGPMRKASESQIRQAALQDAYSEVETASIMDALHDNAAPSNFQAALTSVNNVQISQLLGTRREPTNAQLAGVWADIANSRGVVNALSNLSKTVQTRVESVIAQGLPVSAAENYILSNARNAGAALTREGYDRQRAAEVVKSVINGELSIIAAQNIVSGDLRDATRAVVTNNANYATHPTPSPNAAKVNAESMTVQEIVEVRNAALDTLADPLAFEDELEWAASFVEDANNTLNQRMNQKEAIVGNSTHQVLVSTEPTKANQGDGMPTQIVQQDPHTISALDEAKALIRDILNSTLTGDAFIKWSSAQMSGNTLPSGRPFSPNMVDAELEQLLSNLMVKTQSAYQLTEEHKRHQAKAAEEAALKAAAAAAMREAQEKARQAAANKAKKDANALAKKKANDARRARETQEKKMLEEEVRQAKLRAEKKRLEEEAAKKAAAQAAEEKRFANQAAKKAAAQAAEEKRLANQAAKKAAAQAAEEKRFANLAAKQAAEQKRLANQAAKKAAAQAAAQAAEQKRFANLAAKQAAARAAEQKRLANQAAKEKRLANQAAKKAAAQARPPQLTTGENRWRPNAITNRKTVAVSPPPVNASIMREIQKVTKPGPVKAQVTRPAIIQEFIIPQQVTTKPAPVNRRSPSQKVANALARLPSQQNVDRVVKTLPTTKTQNAQRRKTRKMLGTTSTSTSHDPRRFHRDDESGLGASTSTTSSSRTSGAYRFEDPRIMHRWE